MKKESTIVSDASIQDVILFKKELLELRIKASSGDSSALKSYRIKRRNIARIFTNLNKR